MSDTDWMRWDHKASPASPSPREEVFVFCNGEGCSRHDGRTRRVDEERWEAVYEADGNLYMSETLASRELAEAHLAKHKELFEGVGWRERA